MLYELTQDMMTGNVLIDNQHKELFKMVNALQNACSTGKGRDQIAASAKFLTDYVQKHFADENALQKQSAYPDMSAHYQFHEGYKRQLEATTRELLADNASIASLAKLNQMIGTLVSHIRIEDKKLAAHLKSHQ